MQTPEGQKPKPQPEKGLGKDLKKVEDKGEGYMKYSGIAWQLVGSVVLGVLLGQYLDNRFGYKTPWWTIGLSLLMIVVALYQLIRQSLKD